MNKKEFITSKEMKYKGSQGSLKTENNYSSDYIDSNRKRSSFQQPMPNNDQVKALETEFRMKFLESLYIQLNKRMETLKTEIIIIKKQKNLFNIYSSNINAESNMNHSAFDNFVNSEDFKVLKMNIDAL